ncbi:hypothetical protein EVAR_25605_1 [Eumeta japonica]|uniref:Uncharacterized protein n=1 Tax=Eumeta variegata TaxID=151549 RepID=A0A4C1V1F4_EUMVA|nr:hypothetical protein EVAR_25605_1 [Eumeta japonica]
MLFVSSFVSTSVQIRSDSRPALDLPADVDSIIPGPILYAPDAGQCIRIMESRARARATAAARFTPQLAGRFPAEDNPKGYRGARATRAAGSGYRAAAQAAGSAR